MIARPKISRNERKTTEIGAFEVGNFAPFSCPGHWRGPNAVRHGSALTPVAVRRPLAFADRAALLAWLDDEAISRVYRVGADGADVLVNELVHPVFRFYDGAGALRDVLHVDEELAVFFLYRKHRASALFLDAVVDDLRRGRDDRALGHVLLEPCLLYTSPSPRD